MRKIYFNMGSGLGWMVIPAIIAGLFILDCIYNTLRMALR